MMPLDSNDAPPVMMKSRITRDFFSGVGARKGGNADTCMKLTRSFHLVFSCPSSSYSVAEEQTVDVTALESESRSSSDLRCANFTIASSFMSCFARFQRLLSADVIGRKGIYILLSGDRVGSRCFEKRGEGKR